METNDFKSLILSRISTQEFYFGLIAQDLKILPEFHLFRAELLASINEVIEKTSFKPIQEIYSRNAKAITSTSYLEGHDPNMVYDSDEVLQMFKAFIYFQLASRLIELGKHSEALAYYDMGVAFDKLRDFSQSEAKVLSNAPTPRTIHAIEAKSVLIPVARKIWEADISNILLPAHVAKLAMRITGIKRNTGTIKRWFREAGDVIPPAIQEQSINNTYKRGGDIDRDREQMIEIIYEMLKDNCNLM